MKQAIPNRGARAQFRVLWLVVLAFVATVVAGPAVAEPRAQAEPRVSASLDSGVVRLGEVTRLRVVVEGVGDARIVELPEVPGITFGRPSTSQNMILVNGRRSYSLRIEVPLRADEEGLLTIPSLSVDAAGRVLTTRELELRVVRDLRGEDLGFLEVVPSSTRVVEGQPLTVELLLGIDQDMDYAEPRLPWWNDLPGAIDLESRPHDPGSATTRLTINGRQEVQSESLGIRERDGRPYMMFRLERRLLPVRSGTLEFGRSHVEFGRVTRSRGLIGSRTSKADSFFLTADPFTVEVVSLPTDGQGVDFGGAVGDLTARARTDVRDVLAGDSIKLTVDWEGEGNLEFFEAPDPGRLDAFRDFTVYGKTEEKSADRRRVTYDIAPSSEDVTEIPPLPMTVFDPLEERYVTVTTEPIPIRVRALEGGGLAATSDALETTDDIRGVDGRGLLEGVGDPVRAPGDRVVAATVVGLPLVLFGLRAVVRRRAGDPSLPAARRRRRALRELRSAVGRAGAEADLLEAFDAFLAARTGEPAAAWTGRSAVAWAGADAPWASRVDALRSRLEASAYGGGEPVAANEVVDLARAVQGELDARRADAPAVLAALFLAAAASLSTGSPLSAQGATEASTPDPLTLDRVEQWHAEGVDLYRRGSYAAAAERFDEAVAIADASLPPAARARLFVARGSAAYRSGDPLTAVGWYTAALRETPRDLDVWHDLELARADAGLEPADRGDLSSTVNRLLGSWRPEEARRLALLGALLLGAAMVVEILVGGRLARWAVGVALLVALGLCGPWIASLVPEVDAPHLVLRASPVPMRSEPRTELETIHHAEPGQVVARIDELGDWTRIDAEGTLGWVPSQSLFALER